MFANLKHQAVGIRGSIVHSRGNRFVLRLYIGAATAFLLGERPITHIGVEFGLDSDRGLVILNKSNKGYRLAPQSSGRYGLMQVSRLPDYIIKQKLTPALDIPFAPFDLNERPHLRLRLPDAFVYTIDDSRTVVHIPGPLVNAETCTQPMEWRTGVATSATVECLVREVEG